MAEDASVKQIQERIAELRRTFAWRQRVRFCAAVVTLGLGIGVVAAIAIATCWAVLCAIMGGM